MPGLFFLAGNTFPRRMSKRPIQSPPDRHSGAAGLEWGLVQEPVCISIPLPAGSVASATALAGLTRLLRAAFPAITPERIQGHCDIAPERKTDPGEAFDWLRYRAGLTDSKEET